MPAIHPLPLTALLLLLLTVKATPAQTVPERLAPLNQWSLGAEYSNTSSHIILGQAFNRRLGGVDLTWSRRVGRTRAAAYVWEIEARPLVSLQDPVATTTFSLTVNGTPVYPPFSQSGAIQERCNSVSYSTPEQFSFPPGSPPQVGTFTVQRECGTRWTYAWGLSPVGQRVNFAPTHALQPYLLANGGFVVSTRDIPVEDASRFNFTFTFGTGLQFFRANGSAWSLDYRVQHLSSKNIGDNNPGIDNQLFRLSYTVPQLPLHHRR